MSVVCQPSLSVRAVLPASGRSVARGCKIMWRLCIPMRSNRDRTFAFSIIIIDFTRFKNFSRDWSYGARRIKSIPIIAYHVSRRVNIEKVPFSRDPRSKTEINIRFFLSFSAVFSFASFRSVRDRTYVGEDRAWEGGMTMTKEGRAQTIERGERASWSTVFVARQIKLGGSLIKSGGAAIVRPSFHRVSDLLYTKYATVINMSARRPFSSNLISRTALEATVTRAQQIPGVIFSKISLFDFICENRVKKSA